MADGPDRRGVGGRPGAGPGRFPGPVERLGDPRPGVRRVAILTLAAAAPDPEADGALLGRLGVETDERALRLIARALADRGCRAARPLLRRLYDDAATPAPVAHAAILAHDRLEAGPGGAVAGGGP